MTSTTVITRIAWSETAQGMASPRWEMKIMQIKLVHVENAMTEGHGQGGRLHGWTENAGGKMMADLPPSPPTMRPPSSVGVIGYCDMASGNGKNQAPVAKLFMQRGPRR